MGRPLEGIRVLDFTWAQQGPYATVLLADMGAEIIKVEHREGERGRGVGGRASAPTSYFVAHNRGKHSVTLDVRRPEAREIVHRFVERVDVVVSNMRPGAMDRLGFDYETLSAINPGIVYASASAFGPHGDRTPVPGNDIIGQASGGITLRSGPEGGPPTPTGAAIADQVGAMILCSGILAALVKRERTGEGEQVDASLYGSQIALQSWEINTESLTERLPRGPGSDLPRRPNLRAWVRRHRQVRRPRPRPRRPPWALPGRRSRAAGMAEAQLEERIRTRPRRVDRSSTLRRPGLDILADPQARLRHHAPPNLRRRAHRSPPHVNSAASPKTAHPAPEARFDRATELGYSWEEIGPSTTLDPLRYFPLAHRPARPAWRGANSSRPVVGWGPGSWSSEGEILPGLVFCAF